MTYVKKAKARELGHQLRLVLSVSLFMVPLCCAQASADPEQARMTVRPTQCVVLKEGQNCHTSVRIEWSLATAGPYCLYRSNEQEALRCWRKVSSGVYEEKVSVNSSIVYFLMSADSSHRLVATDLNVAWVYRESRRPSRQWRLF